MRYLIAALLLCFGLTTATAQDVYTSSGRPANAHKKQQQKKGFDVSKLVFGGSATVSLGQVTDLGITPMIGYRFTDRFTAGIGLGYDYLKINDFTPLTDPNTGAVNYYPVQSSIFYPSIWARYRVFRNIFVQSEFQYDMISQRVYDYDQNYNITKYTVKANAPVWLVGAGFRMPVTDRVSFVMVIMYDVLQNKNSPYYNTLAFFPGINVGF